jgi:hypothetical protein
MIKIIIYKIVEIILIICVIPFFIFYLIGNLGIRIIGAIAPIFANPRENRNFKDEWKSAWESDFGL